MPCGMGRPEGPCPAADSVPVCVYAGTDQRCGAAVRAFPGAAVLGGLPEGAAAAYLSGTWPVADPAEAALQLLSG